MKTKSKTINTNLDTYTELTSKIKELTKQKDNIKAELVNYMAENSTNSLDGNNFTATLAPQSRKSVDQKSLKEYLGTRFDSFTKTTNFKVFKVVGN